MADDPVVIEPVSVSPSLLTGKLTGNFVIFASPAVIPCADAAEIQRLAAKFPTRWNREFSGPYQGKPVAFQGNNTS
jgi:hypothetical protein